MPLCGSVGGGEPLWEQNGLPGGHCVENQWGSLIQGWLETHILYTWERRPWGWVRLSAWVKETHCVVKAEWKFIFIWFYGFLFFILLFIIFFVLNFFWIAKWWWLPWVAAVGLVGECPRAPISEVSATFMERWGRVRRMMTRGWSVTLTVCWFWAGERCWVPWVMGFVFVWHWWWCWWQQWGWWCWWKWWE